MRDLLIAVSTAIVLGVSCAQAAPVKLDQQSEPTEEVVNGLEIAQLETPAAPEAQGLSAAEMMDQPGWTRRHSMPLPVSALAFALGLDLGSRASPFGIVTLWSIFGATHTQSFDDRPLDPQYDGLLVSQHDESQTITAAPTVMAPAAALANIRDPADKLSRTTALVIMSGAGLMLFGMLVVTAIVLGRRARRRRRRLRHAMRRYSTPDAAAAAAAY
jgi:hypothetical protein